MESYALRIPIFVLLLMLAFAPAAQAEDWTCPNCGQTWQFDSRDSAHRDAFIQNHLAACRGSRGAGSSVAPAPAYDPAAAAAAEHRRKQAEEEAAYLKKRAKTRPRLEKAEAEVERRQEKVEEDFEKRHADIRKRLKRGKGAGIPKARRPAASSATKKTPVAPAATPPEDACAPSVAKVVRLQNGLKVQQEATEKTVKMMEDAAVGGEKASKRALKRSWEMFVNVLMNHVKIVEKLQKKIDHIAKGTAIKRFKTLDEKKKFLNDVKLLRGTIDEMMAIKENYDKAQELKKSVPEIKAMVKKLATNAAPVLKEFATDPDLMVDIGKALGGPAFELANYGINYLADMAEFGIEWKELEQHQKNLDAQMQSLKKAQELIVVAGDELKACREKHPPTEK